jgi:PAS domain S-box-containing protein
VTFEANTMGNKKRVPPEPTDLQRKAEQVLSTQPGKRSSSTLRELRKLVQDLHVYQIELEMQNEELRRMQLELQTTRDRYAELYNFAPAGHFTLDRKGVIQEANLRATILLGIPRGELIRQPLIRFLEPSEQIAFAKHWSDVFRTGGRQACDLRILCSGGDPRVVHFESHALPDEAGSLTHCRCAMFDITAQKKIAEERDRLAIGWRLLLDSTGDGIYGIDSEGRCTFINKTAAQLFGYKPYELLGKPMHELVHHHRADGTPYPLEECLTYSAFRTGQGRHVEDEVFWRRDNTAFPVAYSSYPLIEGGAITGAVVVFTDLSERKRTEQKFQALLESAPDAHVIVNPTDEIMLINSQTEKLFGYARHELLGQSIDILLPERFRGQHEGERAGFLMNFQPCSMGVGIELYARRKDGTEFPMEITLNSLESEQGLLVTAAIRDITARRQAEKALWESEQRFRELVELLPVAVYVCNADGVITQFNRHCVTIWGREPRCGDLRERFNVAHKIFLPDGTPLAHEDTPVAEVLRSGLPLRNKELVIERPDGSRITVLVNPIPLWDQTGKIIGAVNCMVDITDRKKMEEALTKSEEQFVSFMDNLPGFAWMKDEHGKYAFMNQYFQETFHVNPATCRGKTDGEIFSPDTAEQFAENDRRVKATQQVLQTIETFRLNDGLHYGLVRKFPIANKETGELRIGGISIDITDRIRAEEQLQDTVDRVRTLSQRLDAVREEERSQIARDLHDELGVRLTCLKLDLARLQNLLGGSLFPREKMEEKILSMTEHVDKTIAEVQRLVAELRPGILDDLGLVAAIEWQCQDFELRSGIRCVCETKQEEIDLDPSCATAAFRISQEALTNVMRHAKATFVRVLMTRVNASLLLEVQDDGQGIPPEKITDSASLGLMGMRERASNLGGQLEIAGWPGKGTTVTLRLPCSAKT